MVLLFPVSTATAANAIVNGRDAVKPHNVIQLWLNVPGANPPNYLVCGGWLYSAQHVVTSRHCFTKYSMDPKRYWIRAGSTRRGEGDLRQGFSIMAAEKTDIAVLRLVSPVTTPIEPLPRIPRGSFPMTNKVLTLLGWGGPVQRLQAGDRATRASSSTWARSPG
ncbi:trypsin-like serine protease [Nonomuraea lactucae]|uniref:trypsin-like serine protease n=1 Tax=Nonomuraea lactucae TaxID=2249762 RepID=UPI003B83704C